MVKFKVSKPGVFINVKGEEVEQPIGTVLEFKELPAFLVNKVDVVGEYSGQKLVANGPSEAEIDALVDAKADAIANEKFAKLKADFDKQQEEKLQAELDAEQATVDAAKNGKK